MILEYIVTLFVYYMGLLLLFSPAIMLLSYLRELPSESPLQGAAIVYGILVVVIYLFGLPYLAHQIAKRKVFENKQFSRCVGETIADIQLKLAFVPILGALFRPKKKERGFTNKNDDKIR